MMGGPSTAVHVYSLYSCRTRVDKSTAKIHGQV